MRRHQRTCCVLLLIFSCLPTLALGQKPTTLPIEQRAVEVLKDVPPRVKKRDGLRGEDRDAYLELLDLVRSADLNKLREAAEYNRASREAAFDGENPRTAYSQFADLINDPEPWQGRAVRLIGHANRLVQYDVGPNDLGISTVFESWVVTDDSLRYPAVIVTNAIPPGTPIGETEVVGVDATGYFFQLFTYQARDGKTRYAPLIVANRWTTPEPQNATSAQWMLVGLAAVFGVSLSITVVRRLRRRPKRRSFDAALPEDLLNPATDDLDDDAPRTKPNGSA